MKRAASELSLANKSSGFLGFCGSLLTFCAGAGYCAKPAAAYAESRQIGKYRLPASGTLIVSGFCLFSVIEIPHRIEFGFV